MFLIKRVWVLALGIAFLCGNVNAVNINSIAGGALNSALSSLDSKFDNLFSNSVNFANAVLIQILN